MTVLRNLLIAIGLIAGLLIMMGVDFWQDRPTAFLALIVTFLATVGGVWTIAYATRNEAPK